MWDAYLAAAGGHPLQSSAWARVKAAHGWRPVRLTVARDGQIRAGVQVLVRRLPLLGAIGYAPAGPVLDQPDPRLADALLRHLQRECRRRRLRYLVVQPPPRHRDTVLPALSRYGFQPAADDLELYPTATAVVDLTQPEPALPAAMRKTTRYNIRRGLRDGITGRDGGVDEFHRLLGLTGRRQGFTAPSVDYLDRLRRVMATVGHARILVAEHNDEALAAALVVGFGDRVHLKRAAWSGGHRHLHPNEVLRWHIIRWAKHLGYRRYDLEGIDRTTVAGTTAVRDSVTAFKLGFGGAIQPSPAAQQWLPDPLLRRLHATFGHVSRSRVGRRLIERLRTG